MSSNKTGSGKPKETETLLKLGYIKRPLIDLKHLEETYDYIPCLEDQEHEYRPLAVEKLQQYQPIYSLFSI
jgi:hypothetical protein